MLTVLPIDILYPIVSEVVVDCIDERFTSQELSSTLENPKVSACIQYAAPGFLADARISQFARSSTQLTIHSLFLTSLEIRRIALKVVADGLSIELSTTGTWQYVPPPSSAA